MYPNVTMHPIAYWLLEVFTGNPLRAVNGSIWSLPYEVLCYRALLAIGMVRIVRAWFLGVLFVGAVIAYVLMVESALVSIVFGYASWHLVERHGVGLGRKMIGLTRRSSKPETVAEPIAADA